MPTLPSQIRITELDFDQILANLVAFMKADPTFTDYDFAGSGLRMLSRVLAYVVFYNNYYVTAAINESFLDTAQLRSSVASHARMLGYEIKGKQSATMNANVEVSLTSNALATVTLPAKSQFILQANTQFSFYTLTDTTLTLNTTSQLYTASDVLLTEGRPLTFRFTTDLSNPLQRFIIPNPNIDYNTIAVRVQDSVGSNVVTNFLRANNFLTIGPTDAAFFVQEAYSGFPEIKFGNGVVGKPLVQGNIVIVDYLISKGSEGNSIQGPFRIEAANIAGFTTGVTISNANTVSSSGGTDAEDIENARFLAPLLYQSQNRCVTAEDYKTIILSEYGENIGAINVFGGEEGDPNDPQERPLFGRVFITLKPKIGLRFTDVIREFIETNIIRPRSVVGVIPQVVDPDYIYIVIKSSVKYDPKETTKTKLQLEDAVRSNIITFSQNAIERFDTSFRFSKFVRAVDDTDPAIVGSTTRLGLEKRLFPQLGVANQIVLKYATGIRKSGSDSCILESKKHRFNYKDDAAVLYSNCYLQEANNVVRVVQRNASNQIIVVKNDVGTVNLSAGLISLTNFVPETIEDGEIDVRVQILPTVNDFVPRLNQLFTVDSDEILIQLLNATTATIDEEEAFFEG